MAFRDRGFSSAMSACEKCSRWEQALELLGAPWNVAQMGCGESVHGWFVWNIMVNYGESMVNLWLIIVNNGESMDNI